MKYIDAEKLKAEIRKLRSESTISESDDYYEYAKSRIIDIIESLQQEQPEGGCSEKPNNLLSERAEPRGTRKQERPEAFSCSHENDNEPPRAGIEGVVHHYASIHYINTNTEQLNARLKQFPEGAEVEIYIQRKEGNK